MGTHKVLTSVPRNIVKKCLALTRGHSALFTHLQQLRHISDELGPVLLDLEANGMPVGGDALKQLELTIRTLGDTFDTLGLSTDPGAWE